MSSPEYCAAIVEAEEFAGGPMTIPAQMTKTGKVIVVSKSNGNWQADCTHCGAGCGAAGLDLPGDDLDTDALDDEHRMLENFTAEHRDCTHPVDDLAVDLPSPSVMPARAARAATTWVVRGTNGSDLRVRAAFHTTFARPEGTELRFHDEGDGTQHRVATVRAGSWHWVVAESALAPKVVASTEGL